MTPAAPSRIDSARRRGHAAKRALAAAAAASFLVAMVLARVSHPGTAAPRAGAARGGSSTAPSDDDFEFGSGTVAPSGGASPQTQTNVS
jgi:hypothetical protein